MAKDIDQRGFDVACGIRRRIILVDEIHPFRDQPVQVVLRLDRIGLARQAEPAGEPPDVGVNG